MSRHYTGRIVKLQPAGDPGDTDADGNPVIGTAIPTEDAGPVLSPQEQAEAEAARILAEAEEKAAEILQTAEEDGLARGKKAACLKFLELSGKLEADVYALEGEVATIVSDSVEKILAETPKSEQLAGVVRSAIRDFRKRRSLVLHVAEEDLEQVKAVVSQCQRGKNHPISDIQIGHHLPEGECHLTDGTAELRIDVETQLAALRHALMTPEPESDHRLAG